MCHQLSPYDSTYKYCKSTLYFWQITHFFKRDFLLKNYLHLYLKVNRKKSLFSVEKEQTIVDRLFQIYYKNVLQITIRKVSWRIPQSNMHEVY